VLACCSDVCKYITKPPIQLGGRNQPEEIDMNTPVSTKLAALGVAMLMNITMIGAVAYLFNGQPSHAGGVTAALFAQAV
jgi:hypothetical protein